MGVNDTFQNLDEGKVGKDFHLPRVKAVAKELVVVDIQADKAKELNEHGYNIIVQSADESFSLGSNNILNSSPAKKFDVILAEEVVEHLQDLRVFFSNVKRHLKEDGTFIITTPNCFAYVYALQFLLFKTEFTNDYHTFWQSKKTMLYLLKANGFDVIDYKVIQAESENSRGKICQRLLCWLPERYGINQIFVCRLKQEFRCPALSKEEEALFVEKLQARLKKNAQ